MSTPAYVTRLRELGFTVVKIEKTDPVARVFDLRNMRESALFDASKGPIDIWNRLKDPSNGWLPEDRTISDEAYVHGVSGTTGAWICRIGGHPIGIAYTIHGIGRRNRDRVMRALRNAVNEA